MEEWCRLPGPGRHTGEVGEPTASLWEWTLTYRESSTKNSCATSQDLQEQCDRVPTGEEVKSEVDDDAVFSAPKAIASSSVVAAMMPQAQAQEEEEPKQAESVSDEAGDDVDPVPVPRKGPIIKKKVVAAKK